MVTILETMVQPLLPLLKEEGNRLKDDAQIYKLSLYYFTFSLIYAVIKPIKSIRLLITEIKTNPDVKTLSFVSASPSMYSEAFSRYKPQIFQRILIRLLETIKIDDLPEIRTLGRFIWFDGSLFLAFKTMAWAVYSTKCQALKLHLAYELNRMIPVQFISTAANYSERKALLALLEAGVTYITDRGYLAFHIFQQITAHHAFFMIRIRYNPAFRLKLSQTLFSTTRCTPVHASCPELMRPFLPGSSSPPGPQKWVGTEPIVVDLCPVPRSAPKERSR